MMQARAKMAIKSGGRVDWVRWTVPNGLDSPQIYFARQEKIQNLVEDNQNYQNQRDQCLLRFRDENEAAEVIPFQVVVENEELPPKKRRTDFGDGSMLL